MSEMQFDHTGEPLEQEWIDAADYEQEQGPDAWSEMRPIPVTIDRTENERVAPETVALTSWPVGTSGPTGSGPTQICPHNYHRYKAKFTWVIPANTTVFIATDPTKLSSNAFGVAYQITVGATAITNSTQIMPEYDGQKPLYAVANNPGVVVSVLDEGYKTVQ